MDAGLTRLARWCAGTVLASSVTTPATTGGRGEDATKGAPFDAAKEEDKARKGESSYMKKKNFFAEKNLDKKDERFTHRVSDWAGRNGRIPR